MRVYELITYTYTVGKRSGEPIPVERSVDLYTTVEKAMHGATLHKAPYDKLSPSGEVQWESLSERPTHLGHVDGTLLYRVRERMVL